MQKIIWCNEINIAFIQQHNTYSWGIKGFNKMPLYGVKLPYLQAVWAGQGWILPLKHGSLALSVPIYRNFQSNGAKWRSLKC